MFNHHFFSNVADLVVLVAFQTSDTSVAMSAVKSFTTDLLLKHSVNIHC
jgi:hypothetical protein